VRDIEAILAQQAAWEDRRRVADDWFNGLELGSVVHYDHGFGQWVRCEVVAYDPAVHTTNGLNRDMEEGYVVLRPFALVGPAWKPSDLPGYLIRSDGEKVANYCYHAKVIADGQVWRPDYACCFESGRVEARKGDPTGMDEHSLDPDTNVRVLG
jgi:hypothetical protein